MLKYTIIIEKARSGEAENNYSAYCPDIPGCVATGKTEQETLQRMKKAIEFHLEGLREINQPLPVTTCTIRQIEVGV